VARENTARRGASPSADAAPGDLRTVAGNAAIALDRLVHDRTRLAMLSALAVNATLGFTELKQLLRVTDGNLSVHARKLEEAGYVECTKSFRGRVPKTEYRLAPVGRRALEQYLDHMEALICAARNRT
jgi:DNA-binding transcriptional ArsR family regulator